MSRQMFRNVNAEPILSELHELKGSLSYLSAHDIYKAYTHEPEQYPELSQYASQFRSDSARTSMICRLMSYHGWKHISKRRWAAPEENQ